MTHLIDKYLEAQANRWAPTTLKSERARLNTLAPHLNGDPLYLWNNLQHLAPYARKTAFVRAGAFWMWAHNSPVYRDWMSANNKLFANCYLRERLVTDYGSALSAIETIEDPAIRKRALEMLNGAVRYCESVQPIGDVVMGKGGKVRTDFRQEVPGPAYQGTYIKFWRELKKVGLKPHTLRKLALTRMADNGASLFDLMEVAGWSSPQTAASYIQPRQVSKLKKLLAA